MRATTLVLMAALCCGAAPAAGPRSGPSRADEAPPWPQLNGPYDCYHNGRILTRGYDGRLHCWDLAAPANKSQEPVPE